MEGAAYSQQPSTKKGRARRDRIISSATTLFHLNGYHGTGIDDIGAAAGITGPGVYRHFAGKDEILMAVFDRMWMVLRDGIDAADTLPPDRALDVLVDLHVDHAIERSAEIALLHRELRNLPPGYQEMASRNRTTYEDAWAIPMCELRSDVTIDEARLIARSAHWMVNAYAALADATTDAIGEVRARALLRDMAIELVRPTRLAVVAGPD